MPRRCRHPLDDESNWLTNYSTLVAPNLSPDLLWRGTGGGNFFDNTSGRDGPFEDPSSFLVFGGMVFVSFVQSLPTDGAKL